MKKWMVGVGVVVVLCFLFFTSLNAIADVWVTTPYVTLTAAPNPEVDWTGDTMERATSVDGPWEAVNALFDPDAVVGGMIDPNVVDGQVWYYRLRAWDECENGSGWSGASDRVLVNFEGPAPITLESRVNGCNGEVQLTLGASIDPFFAEYVVEGSDDGGGTFVEIYRGVDTVCTDVREPGDVLYRAFQKDACCFQSVPTLLAVVVIANTEAPVAPSPPIVVGQ